MPLILAGQQLIPPTLLDVLHDCQHHVPPLYFAEFEAIYQAERILIVAAREKTWAWRWKHLRGWVKSDPEAIWDPEYRVRLREATQCLSGWRFLTRLRAYYLVFMARGCMPEPDVDPFKAFEQLSAARVDAVLADLPQLVLSAKELAHLSSFEITLITPSQDSLPSYLPPRPARASTCVILRLAHHLQRQHGVDKEGAWNRVSRQADGDPEEWLCGTPSPVD
ncbi:hypothetical protein JCM10207_001040 [Rhodosporidiobolus poonsookiae]